MYQVNILRIVSGALALVMLWGCGATAATPTPTATLVPTVPPTATAVPVVADGVVLGEMVMAGKTRDAVAAAVAQYQIPNPEINVTAGTYTTTLVLTQVTFDQDATVDAIMAATAQQQVVPQLTYDTAEIGTQLEAVRQVVEATSGAALEDGEGSYDAFFVAIQGQTLDIELGTQTVLDALATGAREVMIPLDPSPNSGLPSQAQLQEAIESMASNWPGIVGVYVYNLDTDEVVASLNENTVFSGASVMKVPILLNAYANVTEFNSDEISWMRRMIIDSDNLAANRMLAVSVGGVGTEAAYQGAQQMNTMLKSLGLEHSYQNLPYEAREYLIGVLNYQIQGGPKQEGQPPFTDADPMLRTTPAEMSKVFGEIYRCSNGTGMLLDLYPDTLTAERCGEMLDLMHENADYSRMMSGLPDDAYVSHKSGWIEDMQADVGIVTTPNNQHFVMAIYVYREITPEVGYLLDGTAGPVIGGFARLIYSSFMPEMSAE